MAADIGRRAPYNPFSEALKSDDLEGGELPDLFEPTASSAWQDVLQATNHLIVGPGGCGKTMLLRRLSYQARDPEPAAPIVGVYVQVSRLAGVFEGLTHQTREAGASRHVLRKAYRDVFADYMCFELAKEITRSVEATLVDQGGVVESQDLAKLADLTGHFNDVAALLDHCDRAQKDIEDSFAEWEVRGLCNYKPVFNIGSSPGRIVSAAGVALARVSSLSRPFYLLLDQSGAIPEDCQRVVNVLLQRGRPFKTKLAARPYEWRTMELHPGGTLQPNDFRALFVVYPEERTSEYQAQMRAIANRILAHRIHRGPPRAGWPTGVSVTIDDLLETRGLLEEFCLFSSGNPEHFLTLCAAAFRVAGDNGSRGKGSLPLISRPIGKQALAACSRILGHPDPALDEFCKAIFRRQRGRRQSNGVMIRSEEGTLFRTLPPEVETKLRMAFAEGLLRAPAGAVLDLQDLPSEFVLSRVLLPRLQVSLSIPADPPMALDVDFVKENCRERGGGRGATAPEPLAKGERLEVLLSPSFADSTASDQAVTKRALGKAGVTCTTASESGDARWKEFRRQLVGAKVLLADLTDLRPGTFFAIGLAAALKKAVVCIFDDADDMERLGRLPEYAQALHIVTFSRRAERLDALGPQVRREAEYLLGLNVGEFARVKLTGESLRPRRPSDRTVYVSLPAGQPWDEIAGQLRGAIEGWGYRPLEEEDVGLFGANALQRAVFCAALATASIIGLVAGPEPSYLQYYKLGLVANMPNRRVLQVELKRTPSAIPLSLDLTPSVVWSDPAGFLRAAREFVVGTK